MKSYTTYTKEQIIDEVVNLLNENKEWEDRYEKYIKEINTVLSNQKANYKKFRKPEQLLRYSSVSRRDGKTYDLRYEGQSVALVSCTRTGIRLEPNKDNASRFGFNKWEEKVKSWKWDDKRASEFRSHFKNRAKETKNYTQPEHRLESRMLDLFYRNKKNSNQKKPFEIQPVQLYYSFFQMPTPIKASDHKKLPSYSKYKGGGIDILARVNGPRLCVMELKDGNNNSESQSDAMGQAIAYAAFITRLLRSKSGQKWFDFFMRREKEPTNGGKVPENLEIDVITIMPDGDTEEFRNEDLTLEDYSTTLHCHTLYFDNGKFDNGNGPIEFTDKSTYPPYLKAKKQ